MCGIVGMVGTEDVNQTLYDALTVLQHRGQDAAGMSTSDGQRLRLRGRGVPSTNGAPAGDLIVVVQIRPPKELDERSRELMEEFATLNPGA